MAEKQTLLELDLGTDAVVQKSKELNEQIKTLRENLNTLKKAEGDNTEAIVKKEAALKKVSNEYTNNQKVLSALITSNAKSIPVQEKVTLLLEKENATREEAKKSITEISKLRDQLNVNNKDEAKLLDALNKKLDENNTFLKQTGSEREKQILNIGNYKDSIKEALNETGLFSGELASLGKVTYAFTETFSLVKKDLGENVSLIKNSAKETEGLTATQKALTIGTNIATGATRIFTLALAATGIGLIIAAVALLIGYLRTFDPVMDRVEQVFSAVGAVVEVVSKVIVDFVSGLSDIGATMDKVGKFLSNPIDSFKELGNEMKEAANAAIQLKKDMQDLEDVTIKQDVANAKASQQIKELMLQSKNRSLSESERIKKLQEANKIEEDNYNQRAALANKELDVAQRAITIKAGITDEDIKRLNKEGVAYAIALKDKINVSDEEIKAIQEAEIAKFKILEESTTIREKIQNQQSALNEKLEAEAEAQRKKAEENRKKALANASNLAKSELEYFLSTQGIKIKSLQEEIKIAEQVRDKKFKIAQAEFNASEKTEADKLKLLTDQNNIRDEFLKKQTDAVVTNASRELDAFIEANISKIDSQKFFSDLALQEEQRRLDAILQQQISFEQLRLDQGITSEYEYQEAIKAIQTDYQTKNDEAKALRAEAENERKTIDLENQRAYEDLVFQENLAIQLDRLEQSRLQEIANAEKTGANIDLINKKYQASKVNLEKQSRLAQVDNTRQAIGDIGTLMTGFFGENKQLSAALATADMFLAIQKAYTTQLVPGDPTSIARATLAAIKAGAFGLLNVAKISGVKLAKGVIGLEGPGTGTSDSIPAMLSRGESVINAKSSSMFAPLLSAINQAGGGVGLASGGVASSFGISNSINNSSKGQIIDYDILASKIAQANASLPPPVLPIEDFHLANNSYVQLITGANH
ncbi:hypothetical protein [Flavobacterium sp.]|uniref:hypothetical protein n=1 Tax=Flavobacterium sp. TaxID=239 RepID=UPI0025BF0910|nr:hypothetical protein [Flavobacterium sp.]MBA4154158.1 hypothetical protein [Flavobacterium sp.]